MTVRRLWLLVLVLVAVISVIINAVVLSSLTGKYFTDYRAESYENHLDEIIKYSKSALQEENLSVMQMAIELETHLDDPITHIKLYDAQGTLLVDVNEENHIEDITLIKEMNMNAVRMSHDPPDKRFLELCDELGLYVINELAGWQAAYSTTIGRKLIKEMVLT